MDPSQSDIIDQDGLILPMQDVLLAGTAVVDGCSLDVAQGIAQYHAGGGGGVEMENVCVRGKSSTASSLASNIGEP